MLFNIHCTAVRNILRVIYRITFNPWLDETSIGVLINRGNRCFLGEDLLGHVVVGITRFFSGFERRLMNNLIVSRVVES